MYRNVAHQIDFTLTGTTSPAIPFSGYAMLGLLCPAGISSTAVTFTACKTKDGTFVAVTDSDGNAPKMTVAASKAVALEGTEADAVAPWAYIKLVFNASETAKTFTVALK